MLNLIGYSNAQVRVKQTKTEDSVLESVRDRIRNYLAHEYEVGNKLRTTSAQLVVKRNVEGIERRVLAIKIANETFDFVPLENDRDDVEQIQEVPQETEPEPVRPEPIRPNLRPKGRPVLKRIKVPRDPDAIRSNNPIGKSPATPPGLK